MGVAVKEWDGGAFYRSTVGGKLGRGGRRHAPMGEYADGSYPDGPGLVTLLFETERGIKRAAERLRPRAGDAADQSEAQILFDQRGSALAWPRELVVIVKVTPFYAVLWRGVLTQRSGEADNPKLSLDAMRATPHWEAAAAQWVFEQARYSPYEAARLAMPFRQDAPAGSMGPLRDEAIRKLGVTTDLRAVLGPSEAQPYLGGADAGFDEIFGDA